MALEPAGVSLQAEGFNQYIKQLSRIDNLQQAVFDVDGREVTVAFGKVAKAAKNYERGIEKAGKETKGLVAATVTAGNLASGAIDQIAGAIINLGQVAATTFAEIVKGGVALNQQFELSERVFANVFSDPQLGKATVDFLNETADGLRIGRREAASFAQTILPKSGGLDEFTELLRLTDIQADTAGQSISELEFSIREALSGDFVSLKDRFDLGTEQINRIKELTPELGRSQALIAVITEEFERLGKTDISGTLGANIKDLQSVFTGLQADLGKPVFDQLRVQAESLLGALDRNQEGLQRTALALGEVVANAVELIGTEIVQFVDGLDFAAIEKGIDNLNLFVETLRIVAQAVNAAFDTGVIQTAFGILTGNVKQTLTGLEKLKEANFQQVFDDIGRSVANVGARQAEYKRRVDEAANAQSSFNAQSRQAIDDLLAQSSAQDQATRAVQAYTNTLKQAQNLQLSFARAAEDSTIKLARANEDIARKQAKAVADLEERQAKDRAKLLDDQAKQLDDFEKDRRKQIAKGESDIRKARQEAGEQRKRDQQKLQRDLLRAQEQFNLSQLQSERRFELSESRLRAEGDILALKELREDRSLERQEEKENFDISQKERKQDASQQQKEQDRNLKKQLDQLKGDLEDQRAELLRSFDQQLEAQRQSQLEQQELQRRRFEEDAQERAIALAREEEDRRLSQTRQLEDLGRSFAEQEGITAEGAAAVAAELEKIFGIEGAATSIMSGFTKNTEDSFSALFKNLEAIVSKAKIDPPKTVVPITNAGAGGFGGRLGGPSEFQEGGIVPGPIGSPQLIQAHAGEAVLPTSLASVGRQILLSKDKFQRQSVSMSAPVIPRQNVDVVMSGGFDIRGGGEAGQAAVQAAMSEMTDNFRIAVERLVRRN